MHEFQTVVEIAAPPEAVWSVLTDFAAYSHWNPFIRHVQGHVAEGRSIDAYVRLPGTRRMRFRVKVLRLDAPRELRWRARLLAPGVFAGVHRLTLAPLPDGGVRVEQSLRCGGLITPLLRIWIERSACRALREMDAALKGRVERGPQDRSSPAAPPAA